MKAGEKFSRAPAEKVGESDSEKSSSPPVKKREQGQGPNKNSLMTTVEREDKNPKLKQK